MKQYLQSVHVFAYYMLTWLDRFAYFFSLYESHSFPVYTNSNMELESLLLAPIKWYKELFKEFREKK